MRRLNLRKILLLACFAIMLLPISVSAAVKNGIKVNQWTGKGGNYYYLDENGKYKKGVHKIKNKLYFFDSNGVQRTGWRKKGSAYYYFNIGKKADGYRVSKCTVNGIKIAADGKAQLTNERARRKVAVMVQINEWVDKITSPWKTRDQKLKQCFNYLRKNIPYRYVSGFRGKTDTNWDLWGAEYVLKNRKSDCHPFASTFAYMANALGYKDIKVCSLVWHSFTYVDGKYYDVSLARHNKTSYYYFGMKSYYKNQIRYTRNINT